MYLWCFFGVNLDYSDMDFAYSKTDLKYQPQFFDEEVQNNFGKNLDFEIIIKFIFRQTFFSDKKLEDSFQKSMDAGMLRYVQPKGANEIKVSFHVYKHTWFIQNSRW